MWTNLNAECERIVVIEYRLEMKDEGLSTGVDKNFIGTAQVPFSVSAIFLHASIQVSLSQVPELLVKRE